MTVADVVVLLEDPSTFKSSLPAPVISSELLLACDPDTETKALPPLALPPAEVAMVSAMLFPA